MLIINALILAAGFFALIKGADLFVDGSAGLAKHFHVPELIIGLTIVALGTSAPELAVSTSAALQGSNEIALSNVIGSNTFNLLCVLGCCAALHPVPVDRAVLRRDFPLTIVVTVFVLLASSGALLSGELGSLGMDDRAGMVSRPISLTLLVAFAIYICYLIVNARRHPQEEKGGGDLPLWRYALCILGGVAMIVGGGQAVVYSAKEIARAAGMTETLIGLTIVAVGTSLPELVTSIVAARKGETGLAVGNAIGSNLFNLMFILGVSATIRPITVNAASVWDLTILLGVSLMCLTFSATGRRVNRAEGLVMLAAYVADVAFAIAR